MNSRKDRKFLVAMALMEQISERLDTVSYVWGGLAVDVYERRFLRKHSDVDYFIVDLQRLSSQFREALLHEGWDVKAILDSHLLVARKDGIKLHLGNVEVDGVVNWRHNGNNGTITFPVSWLREKPVDFCDIEVHIVEPEFGYVLKTNPTLMNPKWVLRDKDKPDIKILEKILLQKEVDLDSLRLQVSNF